MAKPPPFAVLLREIPLHRKFEVLPATVADWIKGLPMRDALGAPDDDPNAGHGHADLELYGEDTHFFAAGTFKGDLQVACSRCIETVTIKIDERLLVTFMPKDELPADDDNSPASESEDGPEVASGDLDLFGYEGEWLDLEPLFREQFVLAIPYAPLCKEDCKGLCPQCGIDRNSATCTCEKPIDPRLAGLKDLKLPS